MPNYIVTAAYEDVVDTPQVYETEVAASDPGEAAELAQRQAVEDNGGTWPDDLNSYKLADIYARVRPVNLSPDDARLIIDALEDAATWARRIESSQEQHYNALREWLIAEVGEPARR